MNMSITPYANGYIVAGKFFYTLYSAICYRDSLIELGDVLAS
jgi:hypothetical protein